MNGLGIHFDIACAIARSIELNEIVTFNAKDGDEYQAYGRVLFAECEGTVETPDVTEYWGVDLEGNNWRVHVRPDWIHA